MDQNCTQQYPTQIRMNLFNISSQREIRKMSWVDRKQKKDVQSSSSTVPVTMGGEDKLEIDPMRIGSFKNLLGLYRVHDCTFFGALVHNPAPMQTKFSDRHLKTQK